jgi:hypothetical protein
MKEYKHLLNAIGSFLKTLGFTKKGDTFYILSEGNWGLINFQKSKDSSKGTVRFTLNLGVQSITLAQVLENNSTDRPTIEDCHWKKRIGFLLPQKEDYWWVIEENSTSMENLVGEISDILTETVLSDLKSHITDESLKQEWLNGLSEGVTELQRYIYLTTILKLSNDERLSTIIDAFLSFSKGKSYEYTAKEHSKELGLYGK